VRVEECGVLKLAFPLEDELRACAGGRSFEGAVGCIADELCVAGNRFDRDVERELSARRERLIARVVHLVGARRHICRYHGGCRYSVACVAAFDRCVVACVDVVGRRRDVLRAGGLGEHAKE